MNRQYLRPILAVLASTLLLGSGRAFALPFESYDARTTALSGASVATGSVAAPFNNPAVLTTADEIHEWFVLLPAAGYELGDPDKVKDGLDAFQEAADALAADPTTGNANTVQNRLDALREGIYQEGYNLTVMIAIPSRILSGAAYINVYNRFNAQADIGGDDLSDPTSPVYASTLSHRGIRVLENGFSSAKLLEGGDAWWDDLAVGFSVKMLLVESYGYTTTDLTSAETTLDLDERRNGSAFNLDLGIHREWGVWNVGLVGKNLFPARFDLGNTGEQVEIGPQWRLGLAYQGRYTVLELDVDLVENEALGFESPTQWAALGWEQQFGPWFALRAGFRQNLVGTEAASGSLGVGLLLGSFHLDLAGYMGNEVDGANLQLGFTF
jgi:hypothetical protein